MPGPPFGPSYFITTISPSFTAPFSIPSAASCGEIALIRTGDSIEIDISERKINVLLTDNELKMRKAEEESKGDSAFKPEKRNRIISSALKAYAANVSSADMGAVRMI